MDQPIDNPTLMPFELPWLVLQTLFADVYLCGVEAGSRRGLDARDGVVDTTFLALRSARHWAKEYRYHTERWADVESYYVGDRAQAKEDDDVDRR